MTETWIKEGNVGGPTETASAQGPEFAATSLLSNIYMLDLTTFCTEAFTSNYVCTVTAV